MRIEHRLDRAHQLDRGLVLDLPRPARLELGRKRLAAALHRARDVHRKRFGVEFLLLFGVGRYGGPGRTLSFQSVFVTARDRSYRRDINLCLGMCCTATNELGSVTLPPQRYN